MISPFDRQSSPGPSGRQAPKLIYSLFVRIAYIDLFIDFLGGELSLIHQVLKPIGDSQFLSVIADAVQIGVAAGLEKAEIVAVDDDSSGHGHTVQFASVDPVPVQRAQIIRVFGIGNKTALIIGDGIATEHA